MTLKDFINKWENLPVFTNAELSQFCGESWKVIVSGFAELEAAQKEIERLKANQMTPGLVEAMKRLQIEWARYEDVGPWGNLTNLEQAVKTIIKAIKGE
jgi:hypothetical protein